MNTIEQQEIEREHTLKAHERLSQLEDAGIISSHDYGKDALRALLLANGGAAVAMLGFAASLNPEITLVSLPQIATATVKFAVGLMLTIVSLGFAYATSYAQTTQAASIKRIWDHPYLEPTPSSKRMHWLGLIFTIASVLAAIASLTFFVLGVMGISTAFSG